MDARAAHKAGELESLGAYHALTGILNLFLQHGANWRLSSEGEVDTYMREVLGIGLEQSKAVRAALDQIEDASDAIREVTLHGLYIDRKDGHQGEAYLRLYGVLGGSYLIYGSIKTLAKHLMPDKREEFIQRLIAEQLHELRNRIGAHSTDYKNDQYHRVLQMDMYRLDGKRSLTSSDKGHQQIDLTAVISSYERTALSILLELTECTASRVIADESEHMPWMIERLDFVRTLINQHD